jgi:hypothetical protein
MKTKQLKMTLKNNKKQAVTIERVKHCCHLLNNGMSMQDALLTLGMGKQYGKFMQDAGIAKKLKNGKWIAIQRLHEDRFQNFKNLVSEYQRNRRDIRIDKQVIAPKMSAAPEQISLFKRFFLYLKKILSI